MGEVLTTMKIMPDSPDVDLEAIKAKLSKVPCLKVLNFMI